VQPLLGFSKQRAERAGGKGRGCQGAQLGSKAGADDACRQGGPTAHAAAASI
jgi:hypothetical protein